MYCEKCGDKNELKSIFCSSCGAKFSSIEENKKKYAEGKFTYYSKSWQRTGSLSWSVNYYDIYLTDKSLYVIKLPSYSSSGWWTLLGLLVLNIIGAFIGYQYGLSKDNEKRKYYRKAWLNDDKEITSQAYVPNIFLEVPVDELKQSILFRKRRIIVSTSGKKLKLKKSKSEIIKFKKYVL